MGILFCDWVSNMVGRLAISVMSDKIALAQMDQIE